MAGVPLATIAAVTGRGSVSLMSIFDCSVVGSALITRLLHFLLTIVRSMAKKPLETVDSLIVSWICSFSKGFNPPIPGEESITNTD